VGRFLHDEAKFVAIARKPSGKNLAACPWQQFARKPGSKRNDWTEDDVKQSKGPGEEKTEAIGETAEKRFGKQFAQDKKEKDCHQKTNQFQGTLTRQPLIEAERNECEQGEIDEGISHENGPEKVFGILEIAVQHLRAAVARSHQLADAQAI